MKTLKGLVVSDKMQKTAVVEVTTFWRHPLYQKRVKKSKRYLVQNDLGAKENDQVQIISTRPLSKLKRFAISKIIN